MTQTQKTPEEIRKQYVKSNKEAKTKLLKKYGIKSIDRILTVLPNKTGTMEVTKAELSRVLLNHPHVKLKVSFQKQVKYRDVFDEIFEAYKNSTPLNFENQLKKSLKNTIEGVETTRNGYHSGKLDSCNRLFFVDIDQKQQINQKSDSRMILISLTNLNWIKIDNCKYILK